MIYSAVQSANWLFQASFKLALASYSWLVAYTLVDDIIQALEIAYIIQASWLVVASTLLLYKMIP